MSHSLEIQFPPALVRAIAEEVVALLGEQRHQPPSPYLSVGQAAAYLGGASPQRVYDLVSAGKLTPRRDGRRLLFRRADLAEYLEGGGA